MKKFNKYSESVDAKIVQTLKKYKELSINGIARKSGISVATVFRHLNHSLKNKVKVVKTLERPDGKVWLKIYRLKNNK